MQQLNNRVIAGCRRFTCLSPTLVRMEFAPDGIFAERRSLVAYAPQQPQPFQHITEGDTLVLETGALTIVSREPEKAFFPANLETRWLHDGLLQYWRPGDRDYRNLGGTVRSLDRFGNILTIQGVHPADMDSPDAKALTWLAWLQCEDDPPYYAQSPDQRPGLNGDFHASVRYNLHQVLARTHNYILDDLRYSPGVLSQCGYFFLNDSLSPLLDDDDFPVERNRPGYQDWYFFAYGSDYKTALADLIRLTGRAPLPTRHTFGLMFSRWPAYDEAEAKAIIGEFQQHGIPLSTLVIDMEWHKEGWGHWEWNPEMYPDPAAFFHWCHQRNIAVTLNDHPLDVRGDDCHFQPYLEKAGTVERVRQTSYSDRPVEMIDVNMGDKQEALAFIEVCHTDIVKQGLDFWWNDGCKGTLNGAINQLVCNKLCFEEVQGADNRGMLLARYGGLGSHRYGVTFTGDTLSCWEILATQCEYNIRAGHLGVAYVSHDIGGFFTTTSAPLLDPALFLRWLQFGVFTPVFRFHSAPGCGSRKPWDYGEQCGKIARRWLRTRNSLVPYIYTAAREHYDTGVPLVRGLFLEHPQDDAAYRYDEYYFGSDLLIAPVLSANPYRQVYLPAGDWYAFETGERLQGNCEFTVHMGLGGTSAYVKAGSILVRQLPDAPPMDTHTEQLWLDIYPGADGQAFLYEDDGHSPRYQQGHYCRTRFNQQTAGDTLTLSGQVVDGDPLGVQRTITVDLSCAQPPNEICLNGVQQLTFETLKVKNRYRIVLPALPATAPFELSIH